MAKEPAKIIESAWRDYEAKVLNPHTVGPIQLQETRRAFYAGAQALFGGLVNGVADDDETTNEDISMMNSVDAELKQFADDVANGRA